MTFLQAVTGQHPDMPAPTLTQQQEFTPPYDQELHQEFLSVLNNDIKLSPTQIRILEKEEVFSLDELQNYLALLNWEN